MSSYRERNDRRGRPDDDRKHPRNKGGRGPGPKAERAAATDGADWVWGLHPVAAALGNPARVELRRLICTPARHGEAQRLAGDRSVLLDVIDPGEIGRFLPSGAVHQGIALSAPPPEPLDINDLAAGAAGLLIMLDQVTDPQNVGAIFRSAAAFGADGVILQDRHAPALAGAVAKAAAGAVDRVAHARVVNLSRALEQLSDLGWRSVGLAGQAEHTLEQILDARPTVLVVGSEGEGLRRLVADHCDALGRIPMPGGFESLNVSNAAAVALYAASRARSPDE